MVGLQRADMAPLSRSQTWKELDSKVRPTMLCHIPGRASLGRALTHLTRIQEAEALEGRGVTSSVAPIFSVAPTC